MTTSKPNFNTITGRYLGYTRQQWEAEKLRTGLNDEQLAGIIQAEGKSQRRDADAKRFFRSGKTGAPTL